MTTVLAGPGNVEGNRIAWADNCAIAGATKKWPPTGGQARFDEVPRETKAAIASWRIDCHEKVAVVGIAAVGFHHEQAC